MVDRISEDSLVEYSGRPSVRSHIIKRCIKIGMRVFGNKDLIETRTMWDNHTKNAKAFPEFEIKGENIAGVDCEWILPKAGYGEKTIIYLHGGGYVLGSLNTARGFAALIAKYAGEKVLSVGYRLAPENPFPAALEDSLLVYCQLLDEGTKAGNIVLIGDSAGGGLSLATALTLREEEIPLPAALVCISPWTDLAATGKSNTENGKLDPIFGRGSGVIKPEDYAGEDSLYNPLVSPLYGDYKGFPPILIHVGTDEVILDDSIRLAEKARTAGVKVSIKVWKGMWHVFTSQHNILPEARQSFKEIGDFIKGLH